MKKIFLLILLLSTLISCGKKERIAEYGEIEEILKYGQLYKKGEDKAFTGKIIM